MKKRMLQSVLILVLLLATSPFIKAQGYLNTDVTLTTGTYSYAGFGNITITIAAGATVQLNCTNYGGGNLVVNGHLNLNNNPGDNLQLGGNLSLGQGASLTVNGSLITSKTVDVDENAQILITKNYTSNLVTPQQVHVKKDSKITVQGNAVFNAGNLNLDEGAQLAVDGDVQLANPNSQISGNLWVSGTLEVHNGPNLMNCPGSITTKNLINSASASPTAFSGTGFIRITGNIDARSVNPLTNDATIVVDYNALTGNIGYATRGTENPCAATLYVKMGSFTATSQNETILLNWTTATEVNNKGFYVERSQDGITFQVLGFVGSNASGANSTTIQHYSFKDLNPNGDNYYRLRQVDNSDNYSFSEVIHMPFKNQKTAIKVYPVPAQNFIHISTQQAGLFNIYDPSGKLVKSLQLQAGLSTISLGKLPAGNYYYKLNKTSGSFIKKR